MRNNEIILEVSLFKEEDGAFKEKDGGTFKEKGGGTFKEKGGGAFKEKEKTSTFKEKEKTSTFKEKKPEKEKKSEDEKKKSEEVTQKDSFPIDSIEKSNTFRTYLKNREPGFVSANQSKFKEKITEKKDITDDVIKTAWGQFGDDFIKYLQSSRESSLISMAVALNTDNIKFRQSPSGKESAADLLQKEFEFEKQKCDPWTKNNIIERKYNDDIKRNEITTKFIEWCKEHAYLRSNILTDEYCDFSKYDIDWVYDDWKGNDGKTYEPYQNPVVKLLAQTESFLMDDMTNKPLRVTLFQRFLKETQDEPIVKDRKINKDINVIKNEPTASDDWAELIMLSPTPNRQLCLGLRDSLKTSFSRNEEVNSAISRCNTKNPNWLDDSLEGRVKSKLRIFQENRNIQNKLTGKLKSKKTVKVLKENFEKQNYRKFFDTLTKINKNNINEATNTEFEKSFDVIFKGKESEFKNRAIDYILNKLEVSPTSELGKNIKSELDNISAKDMFKNEYDVPEAVSRAVELSSQSNTEEQKGLKGIVSQSIKFDDKHLKKGVRQHLHNYIEGVKNDVKSLEEKLKSSIMKDI